MGKRLLSLKAVQILLAVLLAGYMGLVRRTTRWQCDNPEIRDALQASGEGFIACAWHARFLLTTAGWTNMRQKPHVLISRSRDGNLVAYTSKALRLGVIRGSRRGKLTEKDKGGAGAMRDMIQTLNAGDCIFMTPDGPRGPRMRLGEGPVRLAKVSGAPLLAYGLSTSRHKLFKSWDRFMLPLPFGRGQIVFGGPIWVDKDASDADIDTLRAQMEELLNAATRQADLAVGMTPVEPAPAKQKKTKG